MGGGKCQLLYQMIYQEKALLKSTRIACSDTKLIIIWSFLGPRTYFFPLYVYENACFFSIMFWSGISHSTTHSVSGALPRHQPQAWDGHCSHPLRRPLWFQTSGRDPGISWKWVLDFLCQTKKTIFSASNGHKTKVICVCLFVRGPRVPYSGGSRGSTGAAGQRGRCRPYEPGAEEVLHQDDGLGEEGGGREPQRTGEKGHGRRWELIRLNDCRQVARCVCRYVSFNYYTFLRQFYCKLHKNWMKATEGKKIILKMFY